MKKAILVCDLQFGSTGKGLIAGYLAEKEKPDVVVTAWGANAGHTYINAHGEKFVHTMLANGIVSPNLKYVLIGPGSQLNIPNLMKEIDACREVIKDAKILVHENACVIQPWHEAEENQTMTAIGSTKKGCGAAIRDKIQRDPDTPAVIKQYNGDDIWGDYFEVVPHADYLQVMENAKKILVEGAQGYSLGINSGMYPYVTSRECTTAQILSDTLLPFKYLNHVIGSMRTFPIRVANRYDENGKEIGNSGPCYSDQYEIDWGDIGQKPELTTVTKLPRRVFVFSMEQIKQACLASGVDMIFLNFVNYLKDADLVNDMMYKIEKETGVPVNFIGSGPTFNDVVKRF
jgi:adenylosuccinate synthase